MMQFWKQVILKRIFQKRQFVVGKSYSNYLIAKDYRALKISVQRAIKDVVLLIVGIFSAAFGLKGFLLTNNFIDGGATGISLLITALTAIPLYWLILIINLPFVILGYKILGKTFAVKTALSIVGLSIVLATISFPNVTDDNLLVAVFGGFFLGTGIGLAVRGGGVIDGTEVLAIFLSRKFGTTLGDIIIGINVLIFSIAAYFLSIEIALYSMITYLAASKTLDFIVEGIDEYIGVTIITPHSEEIKKMIIEKMGRGLTVYNGKRGYGKKGASTESDIVYTVVTRLELNKLKTEIELIDHHAFVVMSSVKETRGGMIKKRPLQH
jgi:uncharacterized membrane-anchored protein YitT (DUF2179 family)